MSTGWIAAADALPDKDKELVATGKAPDSMDEIWTNEAWQRIFGVWARFGGTADAAILPALNTFIIYAKERWGGRTDGTMTGPATVAQIREAYNSWFTSFDGKSQGMTNAAKVAQDLIGGDLSDSDSDDETASVAGQMWKSAWETFEKSYEVFQGDIRNYGEIAATRAGEFRDKTVQKIHETNRSNMSELPDKFYTDLRVYNWGGTVVVLFGDHDSAIQQGLGRTVVDTDVAKKRTGIGGSGEWIVKDPGQYLEHIKWELNTVCKSPKAVKKGEIPDKFQAYL